MRFSPREIDSCKLVCKKWNAFLKSNIWGRKVNRDILQPK